MPQLERQCMVLTPFCDLTEWEEKVKKMSKEEVLQGKVEAATTATSVAAKTLCKPFEQPPLPEGNLRTLEYYIHTLTLHNPLRL